MRKPLTGIPADTARGYFSIEGVSSALREALSLDSLDKFDACTFFQDQLSDITIETADQNVAVIEGWRIAPKRVLPDGMSRRNDLR